MLHYCLNTDVSFKCPREVLEDTERLFNLRRTLGKKGEYLGFDGKVKFKVKPLYDRLLMVDLFGWRKDRWLPLRTQTVAVTEEVADIAWETMEEFFKNVSDLPLFRSLDLPAPHQPEKTPWSASILLFKILDDAEHKQLSEHLDTLQCYIAQAWYERVVFGPPESVDLANRCY